MIAFLGILIGVFIFIAIIIGPELLASGGGKYWDSSSYRFRGNCCPHVARNSGNGLPWGDHKCEHKWGPGREFPKRFNGHGREEWEAEFDRLIKSFGDYYRTCKMCGRVEEYLSTCNHWGF